MFSVTKIWWGTAGYNWWWTEIATTMLKIGLSIMDGLQSCRFLRVSEFQVWRRDFFFQGNLELGEGRGGGVCVVERSLWGLTMSLCHFLCVHTDTLKAVGGIFSCYFVISSHPGRFSCNYVSILDDIGCPNVSSLDA